MATQFITGKVRFAFVNIFQPRMNELKNREEYSLMLLIDKRDEETVKAFKDAITKEVTQTWKNKPASLDCTFKDGDVEKKDDKYAEMYEGHYYVQVSSKDKPGIVDQNCNQIIDPNEVRSGDYGRVSLAAFGYGKGAIKGKSTFSPGVTFFLNNVQLMEKGEALGGKPRATDEFGAVASAPENEADTMDFLS